MDLTRLGILHDVHLVENTERRETKMEGSQFAGWGWCAQCWSSSLWGTGESEWVMSRTAGNDMNAAVDVEFLAVSQNMRVVMVFVAAAGNVEEECGESVKEIYYALFDETQAVRQCDGQ